MSREKEITVPKINTPRSHESGKAKNWKEKHSDYPLTKEEIATLLDLAKKAHRGKTEKNIRLVSRIQIRLIKGIKGMTEDEDGVDKRETELSELYINWLDHRRKVTPAFIKKIFKIMNPDQKEAT